MTSQPCGDSKITFDEGRNCSQGLEIPFTRLPAYSKNVTKVVCIVWVKIRFMSIPYSREGE